MRTAFRGTSTGASSGARRRRRSSSANPATRTAGLGTSWITSFHWAWAVQMTRATCSGRRRRRRRRRTRRSGST